MRAGRAPPAGGGAERGHGERGGRRAAPRGSLLLPPPRGLARRAGQRRETPERDYMKEEVEECAEDEATESEEDLEFDERVGCLPEGS